MIRGLLVIVTSVLLASGATAADQSVQVLDLINGYRVQHGLKPLRMEARLSLLARDLAEEMLARHKLDPQGPDGVTLEKRLARAGYAFRQAAQQVAMGYTSGRSLVDMWLTRKDSRRFLLNRTLSEAGIGYAERSGEAIDHFWVITLAEPSRPAAAGWREAVLRLINRYRAQNGLPPVALNPVLNLVAQAHSDDMAERDYFNHVSPGGSTVGDRVTRAGYAWQSVVENLAAGQESPREVVKGWIDSPPHRAALLAPDINEAGIGYTFLASDGGLVRSYHYWTLNMARRR